MKLILIFAIFLSVDCKPLFKGTERTKFNKLLVISFDGFRWDYDQDVETPNMDKLVKEGVKAKYITPPMLTMTSPSHFTTITGRWVEDHGVVHNMMFNSTTLLKLTHKDTLKRSEWWDNGVMPLWITAQNQGLKTASFFYPGGGVNYSGQSVNRFLVEAYDHPNDNETEWRENIETVMSWFTEEDFDFVTLYYGEPDNVGHAVGPETPQRKEIIKQIDRTIGYLMEALQNHNLTHSLNVIITSDHGMTTVVKKPDVKEIKLSDYMSFLKLSHFDLLDYGGFGMIRPRKGKEQAVYDALVNAHPNLTVYKKEEIPENFHIAKNSRIQPIVLVADLGYNINSRIIFYVNKGDHGFHNGEMDMKTIFRAFGPDFKKNFLAEPFDSVNIYPLMCKLLGVISAPNNGSLSYTKDMLVDDFDTGSTSSPLTTAPGSTSSPLTTAPGSTSSPLTTAPGSTSSPLTTAPGSTSSPLTTAPGSTSSPLTTAPGSTSSPLTTAPGSTSSPLTTAPGSTSSPLTTAPGSTSSPLTTAPGGHSGRNQMSLGLVAMIISTVSFLI